MARLLLDSVCMEYLPSSARQSLPRTLMDMIRSGRNGREDERFSLDDINLDLRNGERLALLGPNGAGKTTLLKVMAGIYSPWSGRVVREGVTETLFNVSSGIDQEITGEANIRLHLDQRGVRSGEARELTREIREISELGGALSEPVRTYSAGMMMRLAFAMSIMMEPEILLIDEYFGAGDPRFQARAQALMRERLEKAPIVVFASHNARLIRELCDTAILMERGKVLGYGPVEQMLPRYMQGLGGQARGRREDIGADFRPPDTPALTWSATRWTRALGLEDRPDAPESVAVYAAPGLASEAFFEAANILAEDCGLTYIDVPSAMREAGLHPQARATHPPGPLPSRGYCYGGFTRWPSFDNSAIAGLKSALLIRDPRDIAAERALKLETLSSEALSEAARALGEGAAEFEDPVSEIRGAIESFYAGGLLWRENLQAFRYEAAAAQPREFAEALAAQLGLTPSATAFDKAAAAIGPRVQPAPACYLRPAEYGALNARLSESLRQFGYEERRTGNGEAG